MDTASLIDYCLREYGASADSTARADVLDYLNQAQREVWFAHDWWFREEDGTLELLTGSKSYTLPSDYCDIVRLWAPSGDHIIRIPRKMFDRLYRNLSTVDEEPFVYGVGSLDGDGNTEVRVCPTPSQDGTCTAIYELRVTDLSDSASSISKIPSECRDILCDYAMEKFAIRGNRPQSAEMHRAARMEKMQRMILKDGEFRGGRT